MLIGHFRRALTVFSTALLLLAPGLPVAASDVTTASLLARLTAPIPSELPCPGGPDTQLWILAGQSNMAGAALVDENAAPATGIWTLAPSLEWEPARDPLHELYRSRLPAHARILNWSPEEQAARWYAAEHAAPEEARTGTGPGLAFAHHLRKFISEPIGLIPCAHGGTSLEQWSTEHLQTSGTASLYGAMLAKIKLAEAGGRGGRLRGVLWYQGETEALGPPFTLADGTTESQAVAYARDFRAWVQAIRRDTGQPELPILTVQLSKLAVVKQSDGPGWEAMRETQRRLAEDIPGVYLIPSIDTTLEDHIHIDAASQQRVGRRLAEVALSAVYQHPAHASAIRLKDITALPIDPTQHPRRYTIRVRFDGVNGKLVAQDPLAGFQLRRPIRGRGWTPDVLRVDLDPDDPHAVLLRVSVPWVPSTHLIYGPGQHPICNLRDEADMAVPAFGPLPVNDPPSSIAK